MDTMRISAIEGDGHMDFQQITYQVAARIARITLNVPQTRNALSLIMRSELVTALKQAERNDSVSVVLIEGAGPVFCSGYDLKGYSIPEGGLVSAALFDTWSDQYARHAIKDWMTIWELMKPVVCKVQGACLAGGTELMSLCDIVFAADDAKLGYPPTRGMSAPDTAFFPWVTTMARAKYLQLTGGTISGKQAADWGWIVKSFPADQLDAEVEKETHALATIPVDLLAVNKGALNEAFDMMGFRNAIKAGVHLHMVSAARVRPNAGMFQKIAAEKGLKGAFEWRDGAFAEIDFKG
jgi:enoyl-CoA hydratase